MAFPASPSNNQVHKESGQNRAWVYDSATGTWDQIRETDSTENKILSGTIGSGITFPAGHTVQVTGLTRSNDETNVDGNHNTFVDTCIQATVTPKFSSSKILLFASINLFLNNTGGDISYSIRFKRAISGGATSYPDTMSSYQGTGNKHTMYYASGTGSVQEIGQAHDLVYQDSPNTTSAITYTLQCAEYNCEAISVGGAIGHNWKVWFMEISG